MLINKPAMIDLVLRRMADAKQIVVDTETSGLDPNVNHIIGWVITVGPGPDDSYYIPVRHSGGGNMPSLVQVPSSSHNWDGSIHPVEKSIIGSLRGKPLIFHNAPFDMRFMARVGWEPTGPIGDTMVAAYLVDEVRPSLSLDACCKDEKVQAKLGDALYAAIAAKTGSPATKVAMGYLWQMPGDSDVVVEYGAGDGTSTWQLWEALLRKIHKVYYTNANGEYSLMRVFHVEMALIPVLFRASQRGVRVDEERLAQLTKEIEGELKEGLMALGDLNVKSPLQLKKYFEDHGETNWPLTEKGAPSFADEWLGTTEPGRVIQKVRKSRTLLDSFLIPMATRMVRNGRVHTEFHQTRDEEFGTRTGRLSTTGPNLGAMPGKRQGELGKRFRSTLIPDEGCEFTEADYAACEIRICTHYCHAKVWEEGFYNGIDPHTSVADSLLISRRHAKTINLALMTGIGKAKMAAKLGIPMKEAIMVVGAYFDGLPELKTFQKQAANSFESRGFVATLLHRRLQLVDPRKAYTAVNRLTQGGNADICKAAMVKLSGIPGSETLLSVYDSMLFQHEKGDTETKLKVVNAMVNMEDLGIDFSIPMAAEYGSGMNWGEATFNVEGTVEWRPK